MNYDESEDYADKVIKYEKIIKDLREELKLYKDVCKKQVHISVNKDLEITRLTKLCGSWEREAKRYCSEIGEIRILAEQELCKK